MKRLKYVSRTISFMALLGALSVARGSLAQEVKVPFIFTEDNQLPQTELQLAIPKSKELLGDQYLNAPLTHLDYMLTLLEARLEGAKDMVDGHVREDFEPYRYKSTIIPGSIAVFARYSKETGRVTVGYRIDGLGRPKVPMKQSCDKVMDLMRNLAPQDISSYLYYNTILGVLEQESRAKYTPILEMLSRNIVHKVILGSQSEAPAAQHALLCQRITKGEPIQYEKQSFYLSSK